MPQLEMQGYDWLMGSPHPTILDNTESMGCERTSNMSSLSADNFEFSGLLKHRMPLNNQTKPFLKSNLSSNLISTANFQWKGGGDCYVFVNFASSWV